MLDSFGVNVRCGALSCQLEGEMAGPGRPEGWPRESEGHPQGLAIRAPAPCAGPSLSHTSSTMACGRARRARAPLGSHGCGSVARCRLLLARRPVEEALRISSPSCDSRSEKRRVIFLLRSCESMGSAGALPTVLPQPTAPGLAGNNRFRRRRCKLGEWETRLAAQLTAAK